MPVPKKKKTKSARNQRRSHHALQKASLSVCPNCKKPVPNHQVCPTCGQYKGKKIIEVVKASKKTKKQKDTEEGKEQPQIKYKNR